MRIALLFFAFAAALPLTLPTARPAWAEPASFEFHGLRMGMTAAEVEAAGFRRLRPLIRVTDVEGSVLGTERAPEVADLEASFYEGRLFELTVSYRSLKATEVRAFAREVFRRYGAPEDLDEAMRVAVRWSWQGMTFHFGVVRYEAEICAPSLLVTEEATYVKVRSQIPTANCGDAPVCVGP